ncbi:MAG: T9SS type A sorting domain-containing protein [Flavobacteriales bacterium]|nr:T9SS type A sorting domain-containing protein [Flavobacteriales bacterium]
MKLILPFILLLITTFSISQNLVPNPSFENTNYCVSNGGDMGAVVGWEGYQASPDYFHTCSPDPWFSVPNNWGGYQMPATGDAYCGIGTYNDFGTSTNTREFIGTFLSSPLVIGTKYYVSIKVNLSSDSFIQNYCATNNIGISFSTNPSNPFTVTNNAKVYASNIITDTLGWTTVSGSFIADSTYWAVLVGNFFDDINTNTLIVNSNQDCFAYYLIDDVCVSTDSLTCFPITTSINVNSDKPTFSIYPNPASTKLKITTELPINRINIIDVTGKLVKMIVQNKKNIDITDLVSGIYFIQIFTEDKTLIQKFIKSN